MTIHKLLVANRGEIARRVIRTARDLGLATVAVYSDADRRAPHVADADEAVRLGPPPSRESYLSPERLVEAALRTGADAVHPGYGFLSENAAFAERCAEAGLCFVGPPAEALRKLADKLEAKAILSAAGVPVIPGSPSPPGSASDPDAEPDHNADPNDLVLAELARELGFPVLVKAAAGGGGRGMRIVRDPAELAEALASARREARSAFGDGRLLLERYFEHARHVEVQIFGDTRGNVIHLFERECSIQRRFQKILEEAPCPAPAMNDRLRGELGAAAVAAGKAIGYVGAGTVEFLLDRSGAFHFLEVNARLQVEHPVTEAITGLDLVRWQILVAQGEPLPLSQDEVRRSGCAVEARLYAEDPANEFLPSTGAIVLWEPPATPGVRVDSGVEAPRPPGPPQEVSVHYDPLLAKLIAHGETRPAAIRRLHAALRALGVGGVATNRELLIAVLEHPDFAAADFDTHFLERRFPPAALRAAREAVDLGTLRAHAAAAALHAHELRRGAGPLPPSLPSGWRNNRWRPQDVSYAPAGGDVDPIEVLYVADPTHRGRFELELAGEPAEARIVACDGDAISLELDGVLRRFRVARAGDRVFVHAPPAPTSELVELPRFPLRAGAALAGGCVAPMPGVVRQLNVAVGDRVDEGAVLAVLEAMKMEHPLVALAPGVVSEVRVEVGQMVEHDEVLIVLEAAN